ncbi:MAG TPA: glycosyltransferase [Acidimicrobiales bacterium]|nr:glycosyltransferase [Acidimicrobiales bacterium]
MSSASLPPAEVRHSPAWGSTKPSLSVIVSTYRRAHYLPGLFDALEHQDLERSRFEVVIADDASTDDTWEVLRQFAESSPLSVCVARLAKNSGPSAGRNVAVELARAPLLAFTDDDCLPTPRWAAAMLAALEDDAHRIVQGRTETEAGARGRWDHTLAIRATTDLFETCNMGYHRADVRAVGGFRTLPGYRAGRGGSPMGGEDTLLGWDVLRATRQTTTAFADDALVYHRIEPRDVRGWLHERNGMDIFPGLIAGVPELRRRFFLRWFFSARSAAFDLAFVGLLGAIVLRSWIPLLALLPYVTYLVPRRRRGLRLWARTVFVFIAGDAAAAWSLLRGSVRYRRLLI